MPLFSNWRNYETWAKDGAGYTTLRANRIWKHILGEFESASIDPAVGKELEAFVAGAPKRGARRPISKAPHREESCENAHTVEALDAGISAFPSGLHLSTSAGTIFGVSIRKRTPGAIFAPLAPDSFLMQPSICSIRFRSQATSEAVWIRAPVQRERCYDHRREQAQAVDRAISAPVPVLTMLQGDKDFNGRNKYFRGSCFSPSVTGASVIGRQRHG